jgi:PIN domain nuclease of toxin-antitoxin system
MASLLTTRADVALILDTNVILFGLLEPKRIRPALRTRLSDNNERVCVSVATIYEVNFKYALGKLSLPNHFDIVSHLHASNLEILPITSNHAARASQLPLTNRDPWDRMIVAQALCENLSLVSSDGRIDDLGIKRIW